MSRITHSPRSLNRLPRILRSQRTINKNFRATTTAYNDSTICTTDGGPGNIWGTGRLNTVVCYKGMAWNGEESERRGGNTVVDRKEIGGGVIYGGAAAVFVGHRVFFVGELDDGNHSWSGSVDWVVDIVYGVAPLEEIVGGSVDKFLTVD